MGKMISHHKQGKFSSRTHHRCTPTRLHSSKPWHVDGCPKATVSVWCCTMDGSKVIMCVDYQKVITTNTTKKIYTVIIYSKMVFISTMCIDREAIKDIVFRNVSSIL